MADRIRAESLQRHFKGQSILTSLDLAHFYQKLEPAIKRTNINWRIYELVKTGVLERISRGSFRLGKMRPYTPAISRQLLRIYSLLKEHFPYINLSIWETIWLNEFAQHLTSTSIIIVESDKDACESVFNYLQEKNKRVYLQPSNQIMERYVSVQNDAIVVTPLVSESPLQRLAKIYVPSLEKILVDLASDKDIFYAYQGSELQHIWENALTNYTIQQDKLLRYAGRRKKKQEVLKYISQIHKPALIRR